VFPAFAPLYDAAFRGDFGRKRPENPCCARVFAPPASEGGYSVAGLYDGRDASKAAICAS
jgi:hypothetical protein